MQLDTASETGGGYKVGLEFAPNTAEGCKKVVGRMFPRPADLLGAYRTAKDAFKTSDIVLAASDQGPGIQYMARTTYAKHLQTLFGKRASEFKMWSHSAQSVVKLPAESEAMWLVIELEGGDMPLMCVLFTIPYKIAGEN